jgi:uncharacterized Zn finger protein
MERLCRDRVGLFPPPSAIRFTCSCPDYAIMCKHVAAVMYGVGVRLDDSPELLFTLRGVSIDELVDAAVAELPAVPSSSSRVLASDGLAALFGIDLVAPAAVVSVEPDRQANKKVAIAKPRATRKLSPARSQTSRKQPKPSKPRASKRARVASKRARPK